MPKRVLKMLIYAAAAVGLAYGGLCALVYGNQDKLTYFPFSKVSVNPGDYQLEFQEFELEQGPNSVTGWIVPAGEEAPWVLHFHGNGGNIAGRIGHLQLLHRLGFNAVVFDYRGYGRSRGKPSEPGLIEDAVAVRSHLLETYGVSPRKLVYFGESLGGGVACALAEKHPPVGLILKSTFSSIPDVGAAAYPFLPVHLLATNRFESVRRVPEFKFPKLHLHSQSDEVVPYKFGRRLFEAAAEPKQWLDIPGTHNTGPLELGQDFARAIEEFVQASCGGR